MNAGFSTKEQCKVNSMTISMINSSVFPSFQQWVASYTENIYQIYYLYSVIYLAGVFIACSSAGGHQLRLHLQPPPTLQLTVLPASRKLGQKTCIELCFAVPKA